jgi:hypothetical protein
MKFQMYYNWKKWKHELLVINDYGISVTKKENLMFVIFVWHSIYVWKEKHQKLLCFQWQFNVLYIKKSTRNGVLFISYKKSKSDSLDFLE